MPTPKSPRKKAAKKRVRSASPDVKIQPDGNDFVAAKTKPSERAKKKRKKEAVKTEQPAERVSCADDVDDDGLGTGEQQSDGEDERIRSDGSDGSDSGTSADAVSSSPLSKKRPPRRPTKLVLPWSRNVNKRTMLKSLKALSADTPGGIFESVCVEQMAISWLGASEQTTFQEFFGEITQHLQKLKVMPAKIEGIRKPLRRSIARELGTWLIDWVGDGPTLSSIAANILGTKTALGNERESSRSSPKAVKSIDSKAPEIDASGLAVSPTAAININVPEATVKRKRKAKLLPQEDASSEDETTHAFKPGYTIAPITNSEAGPSKRPRLSTMVAQSSSSQPEITSKSADVGQSKRGKLPKVKKAKLTTSKKASIVVSLGSKADLAPNGKGKTNAPANPTRKGLPTPPTSSPSLAPSIEVKVDEYGSAKTVEQPNAGKACQNDSKKPEKATPPSTKPDTEAVIKIKEEHTGSLRACVDLPSPVKSRSSRAKTCPPTSSHALQPLVVVKAGNAPSPSHQTPPKPCLIQHSALSSLRLSRRRLLLPPPVTIPHSGLARKDHSRTLILFTGTPDVRLADLAGDEVKLACDNAGLASHSIRRCGPLAWVVEPFHFAHWMLGTTVKIRGVEIQPESVPYSTGRYYIADITGMQLHSQNIFTAVRGTFAPANKYKFSVYRLLDAKKGTRKSFVVIHFMFPPRVLAFYPSLMDASGKVVRPAFKPMDQRRPCRYCTNHGSGILCDKAIKAVDEEALEGGRSRKEVSLRRRK